METFSFYPTRVQVRRQNRKTPLVSQLLKLLDDPILHPTDICLISTVHVLGTVLGVGNVSKQTPRTLLTQNYTVSWNPENNRLPVLDVSHLTRSGEVCSGSPQGWGALGEK